MKPARSQPTLDLRLHHRQGLALQSQATEVLYGGAAGGGKSHLMRVAAIIWCMMIPGLQVYLFRRTVKDLQKNHFEGPTSFPSLLWPLIISRFVRIVKNEVRFANGSRIFLNHCEHEADAENYRGYEFHVLLMDELTLFTEKQYRMLQSRVRMSEDFKSKIPEFDNEGRPLRALFPRILCGSNPGGPGHHFVKRHWVDHGPMIVHATPPEDCTGDAIADIIGEPLEVRPRVYIPAKLADNPSLNRREYAATLAGTGDPLMIRAFLDGDWTIIAGSMFGAVWRYPRHVVKPFPIPADWQIWRGADDGFAAAHCTLWGTEDPGTGTIYVAGELYGELMVPEVIASQALDRDRRILRMDENGRTFENGRTLSGIIDSGAFQDTGVGSSSRGSMQKKISRGDQMNAAGMNWQKCRKWVGCRQAGWQEIYRRLETNPRCPDGLPGLRIFDTCTNLIRTLPAVMRHKKDPEDIDDTDDHACDALRYLLQWKDGTVTRIKVA